MDISERLQSALGQTYVLQRELTGGGMARVYLAEERGLGRLVVIKVLSSEMAAEVSSERFTREARLAARLQHPNIVPLLAAGTADGLPFYTMPFVEGESLRRRILAGPLPVAEVVNILRDVTRALGYAHSRGIVHRDIKPDNVLISSDAAVVTDFGIAKAIATALEPDTALRNLGTLTQLGTAMGTPAYMSPEQAAADPDSDLRADIYSLGAMAYELLAGQTPFAGSTPQQQLRAKMSGSPRAVAELRPDTPAPLASLVMRCLENDPAARPQSAADVLTALDAARSEEAVAHAARRPRSRIAIAAAAAITAIVAAMIVMPALGIGPYGSPLSTGAVTEHGRVLVADFDGGRDTSLANTVTEIFRIALAQSGSITTVDRATLGGVLQRMNRPQGSRISGAIAREVALREGMTAVVEGRIFEGPGSYLLTAKLIAPQSGEVLASADQSADGEQDVIPAVGRLSAELRGKLGETMKAVRATPPLEQVSTTSLEALRKYTASLAADRVQDASASTALLREAIALDTSFAMAYRKLGNNLYWTREQPQGIEYLRKAYSLRDRLTDTERNLLLGTYYAKVMDDFPRARTAFEAVLATEPDNMIALDNVAYISSQTFDFRRAEEIHLQIVKRWPTSFALTNLALMQDELGKFSQADSNYRAAIALSKPGANLAPLWMGAFHFGGTRQYDSAEVYVRLAMTWPGLDRTKRVSSMLGAASLALAQGRVSEAIGLQRDAAAIEHGRGNPGQGLAFELRNARATGLLLGDRRAALAQVESVRKRAGNVPASQWPVVQLADMYARLGQARTARGIVAAHALLVDKSSAVDLTTDSDLAATIADAEGRAEDAISMLRRRNAECDACNHAAMGFVFDRAGQSDSAIVAFARYLNTHRAQNLAIDAWYLGPVYKRIGELYESKGRSKEAATYFRKFAELWNRADAALQPDVREARRRAALLTQ